MFYGKFKYLLNYYEKILEIFRNSENFVPIFKLYVALNVRKYFVICKNLGFY